MRPWTALLGCLGLLGCGGSSSHHAGDAPPFSDASFLAHGDASSSSAHDASDVGTAGDTGGSGAEYATPTFPLAVGLSWTWSGCTDGGGGAHHTVSSEATDAGVSSYTVTNPPGCYFRRASDTMCSRATPERRTLTWTPVRGRYLQYVFPPSQGATWGAGGASGATYTWDMHYDSYSVPAGTFSDRWRRTNAYGSEIDRHDVGTVWLTSSGSTYELLGKSF